MFVRAAHRTVQFIANPSSWEEKKIDLLKRYDGTSVNFKAIESPQLLEQPSSDTNDSYITTELDWMFKQQQNVGFQNIS